jgi:hypothetical protein
MNVGIRLSGMGIKSDGAATPSSSSASTSG